jgi:hypothetical protein
VVSDIWYRQTQRFLGIVTNMHAMVPHLNGPAAITNLEIFRGGYEDKILLVTVAEPRHHPTQEFVGVLQLRT